MKASRLYEGLVDLAKAVTGSRTRSTRMQQRRLEQESKRATETSIRDRLSQRLASFGSARCGFRAVSCKVVYPTTLSLGKRNATRTDDETRITCFLDTLREISTTLGGPLVGYFLRYAFQTFPLVTDTPAIAFRVSTMHCAHSPSS